MNRVRVGWRRHGNLQKVLELVRSRPPGKQGPHSGVTPLMAAAQGGHLAVLAALLAAGADPAAAGDPGKAGDSGANTALHLAAYHGQVRSSRHHPATTAELLISPCIHHCG